MNKPDIAPDGGPQLEQHGLTGSPDPLQLALNNHEHGNHSNDISATRNGGQPDIDDNAFADLEDGFNVPLDGLEEYSQHIGSFEDSMAVEPGSSNFGASYSGNVNEIEPSEYDGNTPFYSDAESDVSRDAYEKPTKKSKRPHSTTTFQDDDGSRASTPASSNGGDREATLPPLSRGLAKHRRRMTKNLDETDQTIYDMKGAGHGDKAISVVLKSRGVNYDPKTITTRYRRIRQSKMAETDVLLQKMDKEWSEEEDAKLLEAYVETLKKQDEEIRKVHRRFYKTIAFLLADKLPGTFYSAEACEQRYRDLMSGRARRAADLAGDSEARRQLDIARLQAANMSAVSNQLLDDDKFQKRLVDDLVENERERRRTLPRKQPKQQRKNPSKVKVEEGSAKP